MTTPELDALSDGELAARLMHRGMSDELADHLVRNRDYRDHAVTIRKVLRVES